MLNKVIVIGRLVRDPELRRTQSGTAVTSFRIAVDRGFKGRDGNSQADFFDVVAWQSTAEFVSKYFNKGSLIIIEGRLQSRDWTDKEGGKRVAIEIVAENVHFGESKRAAVENNSYAPAYGTPASDRGYAAPMGGQSDFAEIGEEDGELPF